MKFFIVFFFLSSCAPVVITKLQPVPQQAIVCPAFASLGLKDTITASEFDIGEVKIKDGGLSVNCSYEEVIRLAEKEAKQAGANCMKVYEHLPPDHLRSTCHRIKARMYKLPDVAPYLKQFGWQEGQRL